MRDMNATLTAPSQNILFSNSAMGLGEQKPAYSYFERDGRRVMKISDTAVFRSGTFRNSWGEQFTWGEEEMRLFVQNFDHLTAQGILPQVPVRKGHPSFAQNNMDGLIGYVTSLKTVAKEIKSGEFTFLVADYEILDPNAQEKIASGLWINRSSEIGRYVDNNEVEYAPTFLGFAYVDIPAVEGLNQYGKKPADGVNFNMITEEVMEHGKEKTTVPAPPAVTPATAAAPAAPAVQQFSIGGQVTSDYGQVQSYINGLETQLAEFAKADRERAENARVDFVKALAEGESPKILATQVESTVAFAKSLTDDQFSMWSGTFEGAGSPSILQPHGEQDGEQGKDVPAATPAEAQFSTSKQIVEALAKSGMHSAKVMETSAYKSLIAADPTYTLPTMSAFGK